MNKKGMELSINFFVILIITLVVFGFGLKLLADIFKLGKSTAETIDKQTEADIKKSLLTGARTAIPISEQKVKRGQSYVFGVGISNKLGSERAFAIDVEPSLGLDKNGKQINSFDTQESGKWTFEKFGPYRILNNENQIVDIVFRVPQDTASGKYIFNVQVKEGSPTATVNAITKDYDVLHKIIIEVP